MIACHLIYHMFVLDSMNWENIVIDQYDDSLPRARAGHCAVSVSIQNLSDISIKWSPLGFVKVTSE